MVTKIAGQFCITLIEKVSNKLGSILTTPGSASEDMSFLTIKIIDGRDGLEKYVDWYIPIFAEMS